MQKTLRSSINVMTCLFKDLDLLLTLYHALKEFQQPLSISNNRQKYINKHCHKIICSKPQSFHKMTVSDSLFPNSRRAHQGSLYFRITSFKLSIDYLCLVIMLYANRDKIIQLNRRTFKQTFVSRLYCRR